MTLFTSLGPSADCRGLTQVTTYQVRTGHARGAAFSVSQRRFSLGWGLQGKVARTPHQSKGSDGTVCTLDPLVEADGTATCLTEVDDLRGTEPSVRASGHQTRLP